MSIDIASLISLAGLLVVLGLLLFSTFRGISIGRAMVDSVYKKRAFWMAASTGFLFAALATTNFLPQSAVGSIGPQFVVAPLYYVAFLTIFAFVDRSILATMEEDFFHRDTLSWREVRRPLFSAWLVFGFYSTVIYNWYQSIYAVTPVWMGVIDFFSNAIVFAGLGYLGAALMVGARRTPDRTMKKFVRDFGLFLISFAIGAILGSIGPFDFGWIVQLAGSAFLAIAFFCLYLTVMSLSPLGKIDKL